MNQPPSHPFSLESLENRRFLSGTGQDTVDDQVLDGGSDADLLAVTAVDPNTPNIGISDHMRHVLHLKHVDHVKTTFFNARVQRANAREAALNARIEEALGRVPTAVLKAEGAAPEAETQAQ